MRKKVEDEIEKKFEHLTDMADNDFREMPVWQIDAQVVEEVYALTEVLPKREDYALCSQLRDAAVSITGNIAEGFGRWLKKIRSIFTIIQEAVHRK
jgi:hypothetical protein